MKTLRFSAVLMSLLIPLMVFSGCAGREEVKQLKEKQEELIKKIAVLEKNQEQIAKQLGPRRQAMDSNTVYDIPVGASPIKGNKNAAVTIVEFSDFQCPYCANMQPTLKEVLTAYPKDVRLVFKNFPLPFHSQAKNAAKASLVAGEQGKFWEMHDLIFQNYNALSEEKFKSFASQIGLNSKKFSDDFNSSKYESLINQDITLGTNVGVGGTPTLYVNGKKMQQRSFGDFKEAIDKILKK